MIDAETPIYDKIITQLLARTDLPSFASSSEYVRAPAQFPFISIMEMDNRTDPATKDSGHGEHQAVLTYEINVYSNRINAKKRECRKLADAVDEIMLGMNFHRMSLAPVGNPADSGIYRMVGRYEVMIDAEGRLYYRR